MNSCTVYNEMFCGQDKPYKKTEDLMSFNQFSSVLNVCPKYPELSECFLIKSRIGVAINDNVICPFHRAKVGKEWRSSRLCIYPNHQSKSNSGLRAFTKDDYNTLSTLYPDKTFPFGALIYTELRKELAKPIIHSHSLPIEDPDTASECNSDGNYVPDVFTTTPQDRKILDNLSVVLENSPIKFQVTKPVEELQPSTLCYLRKKEMKYRNSLSINFWNMLLQVKEICSRICCFLKKIQQSMFPQKLRIFIMHLFQAVVTMKNVPFYPLH